jgi:hypothetical protein
MVGEVREVRGYKFLCIIVFFLCFPLTNFRRWYIHIIPKYLLGVFSRESGHFLLRGSVEVFHAAPFLTPLAHQFAQIPRGEPHGTDGTPCPGAKEDAEDKRKARGGFHKDQDGIAQHIDPLGRRIDDKA